MKYTRIYKWLVLGMIFGAIALLAVLIIRDAAAEPITEQVWVLCDPESYVTLRSGPGKSKEEFGGALCGAELWTDNKTQNGYLHVVDLPAEQSEGWIISRHIVYDRPIEVNAVMQISSDGRVACRKWVGGKVKDWVNNGDRLTVYWMSPTWAVTSRGYIKSEFLMEVKPDV